MANSIFTREMRSSRANGRANCSRASFELVCRICLVANSVFTREMRSSRAHGRANCSKNRPLPGHFRIAGICEECTPCDVSLKFTREHAISSKCHRIRLRVSCCKFSKSRSKETKKLHPTNLATWSLKVVGGGFEPPTPGFSILCSTN